MNKLTPTETVELCEAMKSVGYNLDKLIDILIQFKPHFTRTPNGYIIDIDPIKDMNADLMYRILLCDLRINNIPKPAGLDDQWGVWYCPTELSTYRIHKTENRQQFRVYDKDKNLISDKIYSRW